MISIENCNYQTSKGCKSCKQKNYLENNQCLKQQSRQIDNCHTKSEKGCIRCNDGYYLKGEECLKCVGNHFSTCYNETYPLSCESGYYLNKNLSCTSIGELEKTCNFIFYCRFTLKNKGLVDPYGIYKLPDII